MRTLKFSKYSYEFSKIKNPKINRNDVTRIKHDDVTRIKHDDVTRIKYDDVTRKTSDDECVVATTEEF